MDRLLLVEDDPRIARFVRRGLEAEGYGVDAVASGEEGLELVLSGDYPLVILDRMLPGMGGIEVCAALRAERSPCLVLMLTAKDTLQDKVGGLQAGADDYLTKPFAFEELLARIRALLRRRGGREPSAESAPLRVGDLVLDTATRRARRRDRDIPLTLKEYQLLAYLMAHPGEVLSRTRILSHVWGYSFDPSSKVVDVYIRYLRQKIDEGETVALIRTARGFGYSIAAD